MAKIHRSDLCKAALEEECVRMEWCQIATWRPSELDILLLLIRCTSAMVFSDAKPKHRDRVPGNDRGDDRFSSRMQADCLSISRTEKKTGNLKTFASERESWGRAKTQANNQKPKTNGTPRQILIIDGHGPSTSSPVMGKAGWIWARVDF
jgi:hypothetical protein